MRNSSQSKECLYNSLVSLMDKKPFKEIQIIEICEKAGYNRSTFYRNYTNKFDIIIDRFNQEVSIYQKLVNDSADYTFHNKIKILFDILRESSVIKIMHKANLDYEMYSLFYKMYPKIAKETNVYYKVFRSAGIFNVIIKWLDNGMKESSDEMAFILSDIIKIIKTDY